MTESEGLIAVCMATFEPDLELFEAQLDSLRAQTDGNWICVVSDDCTGPERLAAMRELIGDDERFTLSPSPERLGFYRNFERALRLAPTDAELIALCDQDDRWYADKLATLRGAVQGSILAYSDQRPVLRDGTVIRESLWERRYSNHTDIASMAIANTVVGASMLFRRELLSRVLPFPDGPGWKFHDHWIALVALAAGRLSFVDRPLYDYVQHEGAVVGNVAVSRASRPPSLWSRLRRPRAMVDRWRAIYFHSYVQVALQAELAGERCRDRLSDRDRRALARVARAGERPWLLVWLAVRPVRELWGRNETLGSEWHLLRGLLWRYYAAARSRLPGSLGRGLDSAVPAFDVETFGQRRLRRWLAGR